MPKLSPRGVRGDDDVGACAAARAFVRVVDRGRATSTRSREPVDQAAGAAVRRPAAHDGSRASGWAREHARHRLEQHRQALAGLVEPADEGQRAVPRDRRARPGGREAVDVARRWG